MKGFENLKFYSQDEQQILEAVSLLENLGYKIFREDFSIEDAARHNGIRAWYDGEITEGWVAGDCDFEQVTLVDLKKMVSDEEEVLWLNKNTLEEKYFQVGVVIKGIDWVKVPEGATFATGGKDNFVFRKDGAYFDNQTEEWVVSDLTVQNLCKHESVKLFWVKSDYLWGDSNSDNFTVNWEQVFGETLTDSVIKAVKQNKDNTISNNKFTLNRLLGCEVLFENRHVSSKGYITSFDNGCSVTLSCGVMVKLPNMSRLTFFTEDGDELTFDEYVKRYYGEQHEFN